MNRFIQVRNLLVFVLLSATVCACSTVELRDAQSHFSAGASAENRKTFSDLAGYRVGATESTQQAALTDYRLAYVLADELVSNRESATKLANDGLLGTAYMIRVYSLWRILALEGDQGGDGNPDSGDSRFTGVVLVKMIADLERMIDPPKSGEQDERTFRLGKRDEIMLKALPGLHEHEKGLRTEKLDDAGRLFDSAYCRIGRAAENAPRDHAVRTYLYLAQIQTVGAWLEAVRRSPGTRKQKKPLKTKIKELAAFPVCGLDRYLDDEANREAEGTEKTLSAQLKAMGISRDRFAGRCATVALPDDCPAFD